MQVLETATSPVVTGNGVGTGASKYTDLVTQYVNTLSNASNASLDDKLSAYTNLEGLLYTDTGNGVGLLAATNLNDAKRGADALYNTNFGQQLKQLDLQYNNGAYNPTNANSAQNQLDTLTRFSQDQQKMIFVAEKMNIKGAYVVGDQDIYYASVDAWKAALKTQAAAFDVQQKQDANATTSSAVDATAPTLSAITANAQTAATTPTKATATLTPQVAAPTSGASIALQVLISAQAEASTRATAAGSAKTAALYTAHNDDASQTEATSANATQTTSAQQTARVDQLA
jgi:hypothetical protein